MELHINGVGSNIVVTADVYTGDEWLKAQVLLPRRNWSLTELERAVLLRIQAHIADALDLTPQRK